MEDTVRLLFGGDDIAQFIQIKHGDSGIELDQGIEVFGFGQFGVQAESGNFT